MLKKLFSALLAITILTMSLPTTVLAFDNAPDVRLYYSFDGTEKNATDNSTNSLDGNIYGTTELSDDGVFGQSLLLKGGYVHLPSNALLNMSSYAISIWACPQSSTNWQRIWDIGDDTNHYICLMAPTSDNKYACEIKDGDSVSRASSSLSYSKGSWRHFVVNYSQGGKIELYENAQKVSETNIGSANTANFGEITNAFIGRSMFGADQDFYGYIDEFKIYSTTLTSDQISDEYAEGSKNIVDTTVSTLNLAEKNALSRLDGVQANLSRITKSNILKSGCDITWSSSDTSVISNTGTLGNKLGSAAFTATVSRNGYSNTKDFNITTVSEPLVFDPIETIITIPGSTPKLPTLVTANNGAVTSKVTWDNIPATKYATENTFTVNGVANGSAVSVEVEVTNEKISNLLIPNASPDPYVYYHDGYYYYVRSDGGPSISVAKSKRLEDIGSAPRITVYTSPNGANGSQMYSRNYWAPEIFFIDDNWYIYFAADDGNNANHRMYCLKSTDPENAQAPYEMMGKVAPTVEDNGEWVIDGAQDKWAIDGTVLQNTDGKNYFIWSGWEGNSDGRQDLYIAEMLNPWTLKGDRVRISMPDQSWEKKGDASPLVNEGPQAVIKDNKITVIYSCNGSWNNWYSTGAVYADTTATLTEASSWTKSGGPLFTQSLDSKDNTYSTGHACITQSPDGSEDYFIYHSFEVSGGGWEDRDTRIKKISWNADNTPDLGIPEAKGTLIDAPSVTDKQATFVKYEAENADTNGLTATSSIYHSGNKYVALDNNGKVTFDTIVPKSGRYLLTFMGNCRSVTSGNCYQDVTINNSETYKIRYRINGGDNGRKRVVPACLASSEQREGLYVTLAKGMNKITISRSSNSGGNADVDYMSLLLVAEDNSKASVESVSLNKTNASIYIGESLKLTSVITPNTATNKDIVWTSHNPKVATVDQNGKVTSVGIGTTTISVVSYNNPNATAVCKITVLPPKAIAVSGIKLNTTSGTLTVGASKQLTATVSPSNATNKAVSYKSSKNSIATVSRSGKVTAKGVGTAKITATCGNKTAVYTVTVKPTKVKNLKTTVKGKKLTVTFKKGKGAKSTKLVLYKGKKKINEIKTTKTKYVFKNLKKGVYKVKATAFKKVSKKTYSSTVVSKSAKVK